MCLDLYLALHLFFSFLYVLNTLAGKPANPLTNFVISRSYLSNILVGFSIGEVSDKGFAFCLS